ncbi:MAG: cation:proton antiporter [Mesorhizobium sp.]|nr:monovalent cation/H(+) antiporter subunit G [Mesorhizobium sp.]MBN9244033.1 cation:proton antiporter [Mesorhizobium sp.]
MSVHLADVPLWAAILAAFFLALGAGLTLLGTIGLVRLPTFYQRIHAPTLGTSWGAGGMVMASMIVFTAGSGRLVLHEVLIGLFVTVTTPVTLMMLGRSALYRDRSESNPHVPPFGRADATAEAPDGE